MQNQFEIHGNTTTIIIRKKDGVKIPVLISTKDLQRAMEFPNTWCVMWCRGKHDFYCCGKMQTSKGRTSVLLHRWLTNPNATEVVDHVNGKTLDCRSENLRIVAPFENSQNKMSALSNSKTGIRGVSWNARKEKWQAGLKVREKRMHLGYFDTLEDAEKAVLRARKTHMPFSKEATTCNTYL